MRKILSILLFIFTLCILPFLIIVELVSPNKSKVIKNALLKLENKIKGEETSKEVKNIVSQLSEPQFKEPTRYVSPPTGEYQPWNQIPDFVKKER